MGSYNDVRNCLADMQRFASPTVNPIEHDLAAALLNLADAIEADFASVRHQIRVLAQALENLQRLR